jgi:murein DD-endopeptidase MepM/ murein hydrolase activator NlpD
MESKDKLKALYYSGGRTKKFDSHKKGSGGMKRLLVILSLPFLVLVIIFIIYKLFFIPDPEISGMETFQFLPAEKTVTLKGKHIKSIDIHIYQNEKAIELLRDIPEHFEKTYSLQITPRNLDLHDGSAMVIVKARSGILREVKHEIQVTIDTVPPTLEVARAPYQIYQGTGGFALLRARDADSVSVKLGEHMFPAFKSSKHRDSESLSRTTVPGQSLPPFDTYYVFFPAPFDSEDTQVFYAVASDIAGNQQIKTLSTKLKKKIYVTSSINISDSFINTVVSPLLNNVNISDPAGAFKKVNEDLREKNLLLLQEISQDTAPEILWEGKFLQLKNTKVMARYGDKRTYLYNDALISSSVHLGYDLASVENAAVEAANSGVVVFAQNLGIYGNTIVIDHGLGLMSLYGHLSTLLVERGHAVEKGDVIAKTGSTGLAGGDHLHFGILIHGFEVSPLHWWDLHWIKVNILDHID